MPRPSHVRDAVADHLRAGARHSWTVEEMRADLQQSGVAADFSSVFRALVWCEARGGAQRVEVGDGRARFERWGEHHEHARCESCGAVTEVPGCLLDGAGGRLRALTGFAAVAHRLVFTGLCRACQ